MLNRNQNERPSQNSASGPLPMVPAQSVGAQRRRVIDRTSTIFADYNAITKSGQLRMSFKASREAIAKSRAQPGDWVWLSDGEVLVRARLELDDRYGLVGCADRSTLVYLNDADAYDIDGTDHV